MINRRLLLPLLAIIIVVSSCSSKFSVTKKRYSKGYHIDFAKNSGTKNNKTEKTALRSQKIYTPVKEEVETKKEELYAAKTENKTSNKTIAKTKKYKAINLNTNLCKAIKKTQTLKHNVLKSFIETKSKLLKGLRTKTQNAKNTPFDPWRNGGSGSLGAVILYGLVGIVASFLIFLLFIAIFSAALGGGGTLLPVWVPALLIGIGVIILVAIIVMVILNAD